MRCYTGGQAAAGAVPFGVVVVGVTGGIGSGKSTVAGLLARRGAIIIDADQIARQVVAPAGASYGALIDHFGATVVRADGTIDRAALAARVFADPAELAALNAITHPAIAVATATRLAELAAGAGPEGGGPLVVLDMPLLTAAMRERFGLAGVVVVDAPVDVAIGRLVRHRGMTEADAAARAGAQISREERRRLADVVVDNSGPRSQLDASVARVWSWMEGLARDRRTSVDGPAQEAADADGPERHEEDQ